MKRRSTVAGNFGWLLYARQVRQMQAGDGHRSTMLVYKLLRAAEWAAFDADGVFAGSPDDRRDGFIHLSAAEQVAGTRERYFAGAAVVRVALDAAALGDALRWEVSRGGAEFPHLYRALTLADVVEVVDE